MNSLPDITEQQALKAIEKRDAAYDGRLFYAVITTGIYCVPSCSSRAAKPDNMRFFASNALAVSAGFRACKRCKPERSQLGCAMVPVARYIEANSEKVLTLSSLSKQFELSPARLQKNFKAVFGLSPRVFQDGIRQQRFKALLKQGDSVTDALYAVGYGSTSRVYENANDQLGMTPSHYKTGAQGEEISYTCSRTSNGYLMLAATDKGVCFVMFADQKVELLKLLENEFPKANLVRATKSQQLNDWYAQIESYLEAKSNMPKIPTDLRGTAFQLKVWRFLQSIKAGKPVTYSEVAKGIGRPSAIRAAATACAKNRVALLVPCHRVLRADGSMGGFRWGLELKRELLDLEAKKKRP